VTVLGSGVKLDLHNHTSFSSDGAQSPASLLAAAKDRGIDCVAITDHNTVRGGFEGFALAAADPTLPRVIPGVELATDVGEIVGLYVTDEIPKSLPVAEAVARIRAQGGLVYLPHPFDKLRRGAVSPGERLRVAGLADIIEVVNGRGLTRRVALKSAQLAAQLHKPAGAGSDAHSVTEVGSAYVVVDEMPTRENLVQLVAAGRVEHHLQSLDYLLNLGRMGMAPVRRFRRRIMPAGSG
jgi:predicted metal-dependent phosphoesterase TrpH